MTGMMDSRNMSHTASLKLGLVERGTEVGEGGKRGEKV
jgi:hypothetical protein